MKKTKIVTAGMYRSGSTFQFNVVRIILEMKHGTENVYSCFEQHYQENEKPIEVIKIHRRNDLLQSKSNIIFSTSRSIEGIVESMKRRGEFLKKNPDDRFFNSSNLDRFEEFFRIALRWKDDAIFIQDFDRIKNDLPALIEEYKMHLEASHVKTEDVIKEIKETLKPPKEGVNMTTLLHAGHITKEL